jgi:hypothetical protein
MMRLNVGVYTLEWTIEQETSEVLRQGAARVDEIGSMAARGEEVGALAVYQAQSSVPTVLVVARQEPWQYGHRLELGAVLIPETDILFVGAIDEAVAYDLRGAQLLWRQDADTGFWHWQRHGEYVVMAAELALAAWDVRGTKLWEAFVEPPYDYTVEDDIMQLTVMDVPMSFTLQHGPSWGGSLPWLAR